MCMSPNRSALAQTHLPQTGNLTRSLKPLQLFDLENLLTEEHSWPSRDFPSQVRLTSFQVPKGPKGRMFWPPPSSQPRLLTLLTSSKHTGSLAFLQAH